MVRLGQLVTPIINLLDETQLAYDVLQMDETSVQVLKEDGRSAIVGWATEAPLRRTDAKSFMRMWVMCGGASGQQIILCDYAPTRAASVPMRVLADYKGFLQSDGWRKAALAGFARADDDT